MPNYFNHLLRFFLPRTCALCHEDSNMDWLCTFCTQALPWQEHGCKQCALPMSTGELCGRCIKKPPAFDTIIAPFRYETLMQNLITQFKFHDKIRHANLFAALMQNFIAGYYSELTFPNILLPVPLSLKRLRTRGYNQALEITKPLARHFDLAYDANLLIKIKHTIPQSELDFTARQRNLKNSFALTKPALAEHVALIDDVVTTSSTVNEVAKLLKRHGVKQVDVWCIARTGLN